ncbi:uncharacterized protein BT62DRAFT_921696 [Guyanagaster necrorhizus]|uniref:Uncharacterized protein n=1 Tax=Guyanagaster necrorhizus TaxID=856835 RepID=A0A9P8AQE0_9AGAR|nr:uncharacterized protein BT62DRAFT_921696 [Guyanagaster necrorhizus MCA 3950]KAG7443751.1 hypothetical protein BT62DRAFT_921696 [Guyanagaster necrorhizus MCA 3950]
MRSPFFRSLNDMLSRNNRLIQSFVVAEIPAALLYLLCPVLTIAVFALLGAIQDWWASGVLWMLVIARSINVVVIKQRNVKGWKGPDRWVMGSDPIIIRGPALMPAQKKISPMFSTSSISRHHITLEAAGLVALADLSIVAVRTALTGTASPLDVLLLAPGMHQQQSAEEVNRGEFPTTGAITTGYVFRVENPATVSYLQRIGRTGHLVTARVSMNPSRDASLSRYDRLLQSLFVTGVPATLLYLLSPVLTVVVLALLGAIQDWWGFWVLGMLIAARVINVIIIRRRSKDSKEWKGAPEEGEGDLLILLSQDRWVRLRGSLHDIKTVTAGEWLRDQGTVESFFVALATLLVYAAAALAGNASMMGSLLIACLLLCSAALLGLCNSWTRCLQMYDCIVWKEGISERYQRRLDMVEDLILASGKSEWAFEMGLKRHVKSEASVGFDSESCLSSPRHSIDEQKC